MKTLATAFVGLAGYLEKAWTVVPSLSMTNLKPSSALLKLLLVIFSASCGGLLYSGASFIVHHDSINYSLPRVLSTAAETIFAIGPIVWSVAGLILALPLLLGFTRRVASFSRLLALHAASYLLLVCGLGSTTNVLLLGFFGAAMIVWGGAMVMALIYPSQLAPPDSASPACHAEALAKGQA